MTIRTFLCLFIVAIGLLQTTSANEKAKKSPHNLNSLLNIQTYLNTPKSAFFEYLLPQCANTISQLKNELTCSQYLHLGKPRKITAIFQENTVTLITVSLMRDYMADLVIWLAESYGQPTRDNMRFSYYQKQGICLDFAKGSMSFSASENTICTNKESLAINKSLTKAQWLADLTKLDELITQQHVAPFWLNTESSYQAIVQEASVYFQQGNIDADIAFSYFEKMVAHLGDGHAYIANKTARFGLLPVKFSWFGDDLVVTKIDKKNQQLLGAKLTQIDGKNVDEVITLIKPFVSAVNDSGFKSNAQIALRFIGLLYAAKITEKNNEANFQFMLTNGQLTELTIAKNKTGIKPNYITLSKVINQDGKLACQKIAKRQCVQYLPAHNTVYLSYKSVMEDTAGDIKAISDKMSSLINKNNAQRLIVDVRDNSGGDSYLNSYLLNAIISNKNINRPGNLYLLTNHNTFSAAINFTGTLAMNSHAIIVGQPVGDAPIFPGEGGPQAIHLLPNTNSLVSLSFSHWQTTFLYDQQLNIPADILINNSIENALNNDHDEALNSALMYKVEEDVTAGQSIASQLLFSAEDHKNWIGRYDYSPDKALVITSKNNQLTLTVEGEITAELTPVTNNRLKLSARNLFIEKHGEALILFQNDEQLTQLLPLQKNDQKPLELLMSGDFEQAKFAYQRVYKNMPDYLPVSGNNLGLLASKLAVKYDDNRLYQQMRDIAISLHGYPVKSWEGVNNASN